MKRLLWMVVFAAALLAGGIVSYFLLRSPEAIKVVSGQAIDAESSEAIAEVRVTAGPSNTMTDSDGRFRFADLLPGTRISASRCGYQEASSILSDSNLETQNILLEMSPHVTSGSVTSNLTGEGVAAVLSIEGSRSTETDEDGAFSLSGLCEGETVEVQAEGYDGATFDIGDDADPSVELIAGVEVTVQQIVEWEAQGDFGKSARLAHPDSKNYVTRRQLVQDLRQARRDGYQVLDVDIRQVRILEWVFPKCSVSDFGPKKYPDTAAVRARWHESLPGGGGSSEVRVTHYVQTEDELWRWFPLKGCDF